MHEPAAASIYTSVPFQQDTSFLVVGERTNANGSKAFREAMLDGDWDTCVAMARDQVKEGSHLIDVCVDYTGADGVADMTEVASRLCTQSSVPLMVDSTEGPVVARRAEWIGGRPILNSVNLEEGDEPGHPPGHLPAPGPRVRRRRRVHLHRRGGPGPHGASGSCGRRGNIRDIAVERYGLAPEDLLFDPLALPLSTGMEESRRDGIETIEGIRSIKAELPGVSTILGLSNVSFGLNPAARQVLNSVFLHECVEAGLDSAIVHASKILPLVADRRAGQGDLPGPGLQPPHATTTTRCRSCWRSSKGSRSSGRRATTTPTGRSTSGSASASSTATATGSRPTSTEALEAGRAHSRSSTTSCWPG